MTDDRQPDDKTTGHEWDGIRELDNPLPRWWLWTFYVCIAVAVVLWFLLPAWPLRHTYTKGFLHQSDRADLIKSLGALQTQRNVEGAKLTTATLEDIERDPDMQAYALSLGQSIFGDNCATCHGADGQGRKGYPNLRDDVWLWGGTPEDILHTITVGVRQGASDRATLMPAFGQLGVLKPAEVDDATNYVLSISGQGASAASAARGASIYTAQCAFCHGPEGKGDQTKGVPNLTDKDWLYGGDARSIHDQIWFGRGGVMPAWGKRYDAPTLKALAVYIHANAGGK
ncbi:MAG: cytochrome c oxidase, cbb3-type, subunit [Caulobacteraceae bacterium]|nr:cytochrome c oxidase, cbb3-type, subunit [Caulobacteraceae bacterium]